MKAIGDMTDDEVLREAAGMGPGMIGQELFDRAEQVRRDNPTGALGPAIIGSPSRPERAYGPAITGTTAPTAPTGGTAETTEPVEAPVVVAEVRAPVTAPRVAKPAAAKKAKRTAPRRGRTK